MDEKKYELIKPFKSQDGDDFNVGNKVSMEDIEKYEIPIDSVEKINKDKNEE